MSKPSPSTKPKPSLSPASLAKLRSFSGEGNGEPFRVSLADIDEDPNQPRREINEAELEPLAGTIRLHGVLQPIGLYPADDGRYRLAFGARRLRASRLAGRLDIPAIIVPENQRNYASQIIENQQRVDLSNSDLAAAVQQLSNDGVAIAEIALISNLKEYQVSAYRAVAKFPPFLKDRLNTADVRALYELYRQWTKTPAEIEAAIPESDQGLTITEARRTIESITGLSTGSIVLQQSEDTGQNNGSRTRHTEDTDHHRIPAVDKVAASGPKSDADPPAQKRRADPLPDANITDAAVPIFIVTIGGERGQLIVDRCGEAAGSALVRFPTGIEEVEFAKLQNVAIE